MVAQEIEVIGQVRHDARLYDIAARSTKSSAVGRQNMADKSLHQLKTAQEILAADAANVKSLDATNNNRLEANSIIIVDASEKAGQRYVANAVAESS